MIFCQTSAGRGRGVFAGRRFESGERIERVPVIVIPAAHCAALETTVLDSYVFDWGADSSHSAIALGYGSLYNHAEAANARYMKHWEPAEIEFIATRRIEKGEEIFINYNGSAPGPRTLVFEGELWRYAD